MTENTDSTTTSNADDSRWVECPGGEISGMVERVCQQRRIASAAKVSAVLAMFLLGVGAWLFVPSVAQNAATPGEDFQYGSICCSDVMGYAAAFHKGELDEETTAQVSQHISKCPHCGPAFKKLGSEPQAAKDRNDGLSHSVMLADAL